MATQQHDNINTIQHIFVDLFKNGDLSDYENFIDASIKIHCPSSWGQIHASEIHGSPNALEIDTVYSQAFKFEDVIIDDLFANDTTDEKIFVRWSCTGTHVADYFGIKASQTPISLSGMSVYRFDCNGKIVEVWQSWDMLGLLQQIGALRFN